MYFGKTETNIVVFLMDHISVLPFILCNKMDKFQSFFSTISLEFFYICLDCIFGAENI